MNWSQSKLVCNAGATGSNEELGGNKRECVQLIHLLWSRKHQSVCLSVSLNVLRLLFYVSLSFLFPLYHPLLLHTKPRGLFIYKFKKKWEELEGNKRRCMQLIHLLWSRKLQSVCLSACLSVLFLPFIHLFPFSLCQINPLLLRTKPQGFPDSDGINKYTINSLKCQFYFYRFHKQLWLADYPLRPHEIARKGPKHFQKASTVWGRRIKIPDQVMTTYYLIAHYVTWHCWPDFRHHRRFPLATLDICMMHSNCLKTEFTCPGGTTSWRQLSLFIQSSAFTRVFFWGFFFFFFCTQSWIISRFPKQRKKAIRAGKGYQ